MDKNRKWKPPENNNRVKRIVCSKSDPIVPSSQKSCHSEKSQDAIDKIMLLLPKLLNKNDETPSCSSTKEKSFNNSTIETDNLSICGTSQETREKILKKHVNKVINLSQEVLKKGIKNIDIEKYFKACDDVKKVIEDCRTKSTYEHDGTENCFQCKLNQLKTRINEIINIAHVIDNKASAPSVPCSKESSTHSKSQSEDDETKSTILKRQKSLKRQIRKVEKLVKQYSNDGIIKFGVEDFLKSCNVLKSQIPAAEDNEVTYHKSVDAKEISSRDSEYSNKTNECGLTKKVILDEQKKKFVKKSHDYVLTTLASHIDDTIELSKNAKMAGLISDSVDNLIKACVGSRLLVKSRSQSEDPVMLRELINSIDDIMDMINQCRKEGIVSKSMHTFLTNLMMAKAKINIIGQPVSQSPACCEGIMIYPSNWDPCGCNQSYCSGATSSKASKLSMADKIRKFKQKQGYSPLKNSASLNYIEPNRKMYTKTSYVERTPFYRGLCTEVKQTKSEPSSKCSSKTSSISEQYSLSRDDNLCKACQKNLDVTSMKTKTKVSNSYLLKSLSHDSTYITMPHNIILLNERLDIAQVTPSYISMPHNISPMSETHENTVSYITMPRNISPMSESHENVASYITMPHNISPMSESHENYVSYITMPHNISPMSASHENTASYVTMPHNISPMSESHETINHYVMPRNICMVNEPGHIHCFSINYNSDRRNPVPSSFYYRPNKTVEPLPDDITLGYFETKVRKVTKITRTLNPDGTIREEKEIVTTKTSKHDPNLTDIPDEDNEMADDTVVTEETVLGMPDLNDNKMFFDHTCLSDDEMLPDGNIDEENELNKNAVTTKDNIYCVVLDSDQMQRGFTRILPKSQSELHPSEVKNSQLHTRTFSSISDFKSPTL